MNWIFFIWSHFQDIVHISLFIVSGQHVSMSVENLSEYVRSCDRFDKNSYAF